MQTPLTCTFVFTSREYRVALWNHFRTKRWRLLAFLAIFYAFILGSNVYASYTDGKLLGSHGLDWIRVVSECIAALVLILLFILVFFPLCFFYIQYKFRRTLIYGKELRYTLGEEGLFLESEGVESKLAWRVTYQVIEAKSGFMLYPDKSKISFQWLPKQGFSSPEDIARCRDLLSNHVQIFKFA